MKIKHIIAQLYLLDGYTDDALRTYEEIVDID